MIFYFSKSSFLYLSAFSLLVSASHEHHEHHEHHHEHHDARDALQVQIRRRDSDLIAAAWFAGWHQDSTPSFGTPDISWEKYTHMAYSFAVPTQDVTQLSLDGSEGDKLPGFVQTAHQNNVKALIAMGGWAGSMYFSSAVGSAENRTAFVKTVTDFTSKYGLDGINFDWEYPNKQGIGCNVINTNDAGNFLEFLQELRQDPIGMKLSLSAATGIATFSGPSGDPLTDVSGFAEVLDFIAIMNYDVWGSWSAAVGPNSPLADSCAASENQQGSAATAVKNWNGAGMPLDKIVLGVASYGHSFVVSHDDAYMSGSTTELAPYPPFDKSAFPHGDSWDDDGGPDACGHHEPSGGNYNFWGLIENGYLDQNGDYMDKIPHRFDSCSQTPYVYNPDSNIMVSFDNAQSFTSKGKFIKGAGLKGFAMWEAGGDYKDILLDAISAGIHS
ncbi:glycoside hydrolase family 18 protein [Lentinula edodes]|uniref:Glycoside hydrolase family 18 protein n=1 Tax=Lentinula lateritia TaxID=40482 RepID=A0A9W9A2C8_9AGAR|nr:glycoside hydrolase family 18 protein [Lentinula edodes]